MRIAGACFGFFGERHEIFDEAFVLLGMSFGERIFVLAHQFFLDREELPGVLVEEGEDAGKIAAVVLVDLCRKGIEKCMDDF